MKTKIHPPSIFISSRIANKIFISLILLILSRGLSGQEQYYININTTATSPVENQIKSYVQSGKLRVNVRTQFETKIMLIGKIERISPRPFTIRLKQEYWIESMHWLSPTTSTTLTSNQLLQVFGDFAPHTLDIEGIDTRELFNPNSILPILELPEGTYRICIESYNANYGPVSAPNSGCTTFTIQSAIPSNAVVINTQLTPPGEPDILQYINEGKVKPTLTYNNPRGGNVQVKLYARIESLSPNRFTIALKPDYFRQETIDLTAARPVQLNARQVLDAFGNLNPANIDVTGINLNDIREGNRIILPEGSYRICFYARHVTTAGRQGEFVSDINSGCGNLNIPSAIPPNAVVISTQLTPPGEPDILQYINEGKVKPTLTYNNPRGGNVQVKLYARIESLSPNRFTIALKPDYFRQESIDLTAARPVQLNARQVLDAFGNLNPANIDVTGINLNDIREGNRIILPDGSYRICFYARYISASGQQGDLASDTNTGCASFSLFSTKTPNAITIITQLTAAGDGDLLKYIREGHLKPVIRFNSSRNSTVQLKIYGRIESVSGQPFSIALEPEYSRQQNIIVSSASPLTMSPQQIIAAFGNFDETNLSIQGIDFNDLKDQNNEIKLPEGVYRICFVARYVDSGRPGDFASDIHGGCATYNVCYKATAPQIVQPVSQQEIQNFIPLLLPASPIIFSWTPPSTVCGAQIGAVSYDFEIRELFNSQTISDAIRNPPVFQKGGIVSPTFILDTLLHPRVLQTGKTYIVRVKAENPIHSYIKIENEGFSPIQVFQFGSVKTIPISGSVPTAEPEKTEQTESNIPTTSIKGKIIWSFKKSEEIGGSAISNIDLLNTESHLQQVVGNILKNNPTEEIPKKKTNQEKTEEIKQLIDPNLQVQAIQLGKIIGDYVPVKKTGGSSVQAIYHGDGEVIEKVDLGLPSGKGIDFHPLKGAKIQIIGIRNQSAPVILRSHFTADETVPMQTQLGIAKVSSALSPAGNEGMIPQSYQIKEEKDLKEDIIGAGYSDEDGHFTIHFLDPKFKNITQYKRMRLVVTHRDFETYSREIEISSPEDMEDFDLEAIQLLAKSYRFTPYVSMGTNTQLSLYAPSDLLALHPHYGRMSQSTEGTEKKKIAGKDYTKILDLRNGQTAFKLFYNTPLILHISQDEREDYYSYVNLIPQFYNAIITKPDLSIETISVDESELIISLQVQYKMKKILPYIDGNVQFFVENKHSPGESSIFPPHGAIVTVSFDRKKVLEDMNSSRLEALPDYDLPFDTDPLIGIERSNVRIPSDLFQNHDNNVNQGIPKSTAVATAVGGAPSTNQSDKMISRKATTAGIDYSFLMAYQTMVDSQGNYRIDNLPLLEDGSYFTVTVKTREGFDDVISLEKNLKRGDSETVDFTVRPEVTMLSGIVVDEKGAPLSFALLQWKSGGNPIETNESGLFITSNYKNDSLKISRQGYLSTTIFVDLEKAGKKSTDRPGGISVQNTSAYPSAYDFGKIQAWGQNLAEQPSVKSQSPSGITAGTLNTASGNLTSDILISDWYQTHFNPATNVTEFTDIGKVGYLKKGSAKIKFIVKDKSEKPIPAATISIDGIRDTFTDQSGEMLFISGGEHFHYVIRGPQGSDYVAKTGEVNMVPNDGSVTNVQVHLEKGIQLSGKVTSESTALEGAEIYLDGKEYIRTTSNAQGEYSLIIPPGESTIRAIKSLYRGEHTTRDFNAPTTLHFDLKDSGGKNLSQLLGFDIILESSRETSGGREIWSGVFTNLKSNKLFSVSSGSRLKFSNVTVSFDTDGNAVVAGNEVQTDVTELPMKMHNYLPVKMKGSPRISVKRISGGKGIISGLLQVDLTRISSSGGIGFDSEFMPYLIGSGGGPGQEVAVFTSDGGTETVNLTLSYHRSDIEKAAKKAVDLVQNKADKATGENKKILTDKLNLLKNLAQSAAGYSGGSGNIPSSFSQYAVIKIYGMEAGIDLSNSKITETGIDFRGFVVTPEIPVIHSICLEVERLRVGPDFEVAEVVVKTVTNLSMEIATWKADLTSVIFNMNGIRLGGSIGIKVPKSPVSVFSFSNLTLGTSGLFGGSFIMPSGGINVFDIIRLKSGSTPLSFGRVGNSNVYRLGGSAEFSFNSLFKDKIKVPFFQIQTDGRFAVTVPIDKSLNAGFATFKLNNISFNTTTAEPQIDLDGRFSVDVKIITFKTSSIHFRKSGPSIDEVGLGLNIPAVKVDAFVKIENDGFAGGGNLEVTNTPIKAGLNFYYYKNNSGVRLGGDFHAKAIIPIGIATISELRGGLKYDSGKNYFEVSFGGSVSIIGLDPVIALSPIMVTVKSGPIISGTANVKLASVLDVAQAAIVLDIPESLFTITINSSTPPLPDFGHADIFGTLIVSAKPGDSYFFFGCGMDVNLLGLLDTKGRFALGFGVKNAKTRTSTSAYLQEAPSDYLSGGRFTGIYLSAYAKMGVEKKDAPTLDLIIVSGKVWLVSEAGFSFIANFENANFEVAANLRLEGGLEATIILVTLEAGAGACINLRGGYQSALGWHFAATAQGKGYLGVGDGCRCNELKAFPPKCGKVCVGVGAHIGYASRKGGLTNFSLFTSSSLYSCF